MKKMYFGLILLLAGCSTPITTMQKGDTTVTCGGGTMGSILGGKLGYHIQKGNDKDCVDSYTSQGYKVIAPAK